ncbi:uncharacterized protein haspin [Erpetoichthys calabaricus]|uniref:uncharacterized protein haspin n=1 Tax=Erpetoichthys calabaricus TaxID=27687 RepID=UPI002234CDF9|nr:uncharacterized protein haspin [Erpetoichthys calabaricus]
MKMSPFKKNGIMSFKTYGKQKQKSEKWILPDRRAIFSSSSSDISYSFEEDKCPAHVKTRKKASTAKVIKPKDNGKLQAGAILRVKNREKDLAEEVILHSSSGKENRTYSSGLTVIDKSVGKNDNSPSKQDFPVGVAEKIVNFSKRPLRSCRVKDARLPRSAKQKALDHIKMSSGFDDVKTDEEEDLLYKQKTFPRSKEIKDVEKVIQSDSSVFVPPTPLQRFVTRRRKIVKRNKTAANKGPWDSAFKQSISHFLGSSMKESIPTYIQKNTSDCPVNLSSENSVEVCSFQREVNKEMFDLNKTRFKSPIERVLTKRAFKRPVVCSTPSVVLKSGQQVNEPSLSDISFGNDENEYMKFNGNMIRRQRNNLKNTGHIMYPEEQSPASILRSTKSTLEIISQNGHCSFSNISQLSKDLFSDVSSSFIESQSERAQLEEKTDKGDNHRPLGSEKYLESHLDLAYNSKCRLSASEPVVCFERGDTFNFIEKNALQPVILLEKLDKSQLTINQKELSSKSLKTQHEFHSRSSTEHLYSVIDDSVDGLLISNEKSNVHLPLPASTTAQELKTQSTITVSSQVVKTNEKLGLEMDHLPISLQHNSDTTDFVNSGNNMQDVNLIKRRCLSLQPVVLLEYASIPPYLIKQNVGCEQELESRQGRMSGYIEKQQDISKIDQMALTNSSIMDNLSGFNSLISEELFIDYTGDLVNGESLEKNLATKFINSSRGKLAACKRLTSQHPISALNASQHTNMGSSQVSNYLSCSKLEKIALEDVLKEVTKEKTKTVRKVCVSGFSANRWSKNDRKKKRKKTWKSNVSSASNANFSLTDFGLKKYQKKSNSETTLGDCFLNIKDVSLMATPKSFGFQALLSTHSWSRLKAALSIHKKKIAVFTPKKLNLSCLDTSTNLLKTNFDLTAESLSHFSGNISLLNSPNSMCDISDAEKVYHECKQEGPISFEECLSSNKLKQCKKIGEGAFGEVFCTTNNNDELVALKIIPIEGKDIVNGENQKMFGEILHEIIISKELSSLKERKHNRSDGFITLHSLHCVKGSYPEPLLKAWDAFDKERQSENDRPDFFGNDQLFLVLEFEFGGSDLENMQKKLPSLITAKSILHQVTAALAVAEQAFCFEHRDLHWGNILVKKTNNVKEEYMLNGTKRNLTTHGYHVNLIDYTLSRLEIDGLTVSCDISSDEALFMGQGDYQFDIYRKMRKENNNSWSEYHPHSNVLWLHYLTDKLLHLNYKTKARTSALRALKKSIEQFYQDVLKYESAMDVLQHSSLFQESQ